MLTTNAFVSYHMRRPTIWSLVVLVGTLASLRVANAVDIADYVGWTVVAKKTIVGYVDQDGKSDSSFQGCNFYRKIVFDDQTYLTCTGYGYHYAYRPDATILHKGSSWKIIVDGESFDMSN
jgi:hypothetical protein